MEKFRALALVVFAVVAGLIWLPFQTMAPLQETQWVAPEPAGEIRGTFVLEQRVTPAMDALLGTRQYCFGIRFATYQRRNQGTVLVEWAQEGDQQQWRVNSRKLIDNRFRYFCPDAAVRLDVPFDIRISGGKGRPGKSPTLWLVDDVSLGKARLNGEGVQKGVSLKLSERTRIGVSDMLRAGNGAFLFGWLCTVLIGLVALGYVLRSRTSSAPAERTR